MIRSLTALPHTLVAPSPQDATRGLMVDVRHCLPCASELLSGLVDDGALLIIGPPDVGRWQLTPTGAEVSAAQLVSVPEVAVNPPMPVDDASLPDPVPVKLVQNRSGSIPIDAVLLDSTELDWVSAWLSTRPLGESTFLLPADGRWLLTAPGGLPAQVPFGIPLTRIGPGGLYLEVGLEFRPPVPDGARIERFKLADGSIVALTEKSNWRFDSADIVPAWTLWVGDAPEVQGELNDEARRTLESISTTCIEADLEAARLQHQAREYRPVDRKERVRLLREAMQAEHRNELIRAAELLEAAGCPGQAGRLYEQAAAAGLH